MADSGIDDCLGGQGVHYDTPPSGRWSLVKKTAKMEKSIDIFNTGCIM